MDIDTNNNNNSNTENEHDTNEEDADGASSSPQAPILSTDMQTPKRSTSKVRLSKAESVSSKQKNKGTNTKISCLGTTKS